MSRLDLEAKVGIFFLVCVAILVYVALRVLPVDWKSGFELRASFRSAEGLTEGSSVQIAGIKVGKIKQIVFDSETGKATVIMDIRREYEGMVPEGSRAIVKGRGLLGDKYLVIVPGKPNMRKLKSGEEITMVQEAVDTEALMENIGIAAQDLRVLTRSAREELVDEKGAAKVGTTISDASHFFKDMKEIASKNKPAINRSLDKIDTTTTNLDELVALNKEKINHSVDRMENFSRSINQTGDKLRKIAADWDNVTVEVRSGKGTLGKLIAEQGLHDEARALVRDLRQISGQIQYGQGTLSRLINDPELYYEARRAVRNMNKTAEDVSEATPVSTLAIILGSVFR